MREIIKMFMILTVLSASAGGILAMVKDKTASKIEMQQLEFTKAPIIREVFKDATNDPLKDRFKLQYKGKDKVFFIGKVNGVDNVIFESFGGGFGGDIGFMVAINMIDDEIIGAGVTTHSETPGLGDRAKTDKKFINQFANVNINTNFRVKADGGDVDALSGATVTSRGICGALNEAKNIYKELKPEILKNIKH